MTRGFSTTGQWWGRAAVAVLALSATLPVMAQQYPKIELRFGHFAPATTAHGQVDQWFADEVAKRSGGQVSIKIFWAGAVGKPNELLNLVGRGALDIAAVPASYFPAQLPLLAAPSALPLALPSPQKAQRIVYDLWESTPAMQDEARKSNVWPLLFHTLNTYHMLCSKPIRTLEDMKGKKIRSQGEYVPKMLAAVGAVPVNVLPGEFYESLQRGSVDCMVLPWDLMVAFKLHEVAKFGSTINLGALISNPQWYNINKWEQLPGNVRELLMQVAKDALVIDLAKAEESERNAHGTLKAAGVELISFPDQAKFEALMPDFIGEWVAAMQKLGKGTEAEAMAKRWKALR
ncbi:MAG: TRAP transporter substrate-binding protein DctP [Burkholderiales bacterium]